MCLFSKPPAWEDDIVFANRRHKKHRSSTRISETIIERNSKYHPPPRSPTPIYHSPSPPPLRAPSIAPSSRRSASPPPPPPPPQPIIELISVEESVHVPSAPSMTITTAKSRKSRHGSRGGGGEEVYIERERIRERMTPPERERQEYDTFRYVEGPNPPRREYEDEERMERRRSRSITYQSNPRLSGRVTERERVVVEDGGRRREYYRKP